MEYLWILFGLVVVAAIVIGRSAKKSGRPPPAGRPTPPAPEHSVWSCSANGNDTAVLGGSRVTVFPNYTLWKFCIADGDDDPDPFFSDSYATKQAARAETIAMVEGRPSQHPTTRETRSQNLIAGLGSVLEREAGQLIALEKSVTRAVTKGTGASTENLRKRLRSRRHSARRLWVNCHRDDNQTQTDEAARMMNRYDELVEAIEGLDRTPPP